MEKQPVQAACYVRVSTENQLENYSIEEQTQRLQAYCSAKGWSIYKIYTDGGYSGGNLDRPALQEMLSELREEAFQVVVVYKLDRLSRSQKDTLTLIEDEFLAHQVDFVSVNENFDTTSPLGKAMIGILSVFAQLEKDQLTERFTMGRIGRSKAGYFHGSGLPPTGYQYVNGMLVVDEYKALQVREVFDRFLTGQSINAIQKRMAEKYGGWSCSPLVLNVLRNSVYIGKVKFAGQEYDGLHQPIIPSEVFAQAQQYLSSYQRDEQKNTAQKTPFRAGYLLSSRVYCKRCGARYNAVHGYYKCYSRSKTSKKYITDPHCKNKNWPIEELDALVIQELWGLVYDQEKLLEICRPVSDSCRINKKNVEKQLSSIENQLKRMIQLYSIGEIPLEQISGRVKKLQQEKDALTAVIQQQDDVSQGVENFLFALEKFRQRFSDGNLEEKRLLLGNVIQKIWVDGDIVEIQWRV